MRILLNAFLFFTILSVNFIYQDKVSANENKINVMRSHQGKHILRVPRSDYSVDQNVIITNDENVSAAFKVKRVDKSKTKILIKGPSYINLADLCKKNCQISYPGGSLMDEFSIGSSARAPASNK